ncbi:MAG: rhomboid family intramembrane serine protease [Planctomycetaceae bacterium]|nr:rhomboid family intramembrane serine protease [Planctomycetaceae bacterium]
MGIYDRDYYRDEESFSWQPARHWSGLNLIIVACVAVYVADILFLKLEPQNRIFRVLAANSSDFANPLRWYSFLTCAFSHSPIDDPNRFGILHIVMNMFVLWTFGRDVESRLGRTAFLTLYLISALASAVLFTGFWTLIGRPTTVLGASGAVSAVFVYFVCWNPRVTLKLFGVIDVPAWALGAGILLYDFVGSLSALFGSEQRVAHEAHLIGAAVGGLSFYFGWPNESLFKKIRFWWRSRHLRVVRAREEQQEQLAISADQILEKVSRSGYDSLTSKEKKILEEYSRNLRAKK